MWDKSMQIAKSLFLGNFQEHPKLGSEYLYFHSEKRGDKNYINKVKAKPETLIYGGNMFYINWP